MLYVNEDKNQLTNTMQKNKSSIHKQEAKIIRWKILRCEGKIMELSIIINLQLFSLEQFLKATNTLRTQTLLAYNINSSS